MTHRHDDGPPGDLLEHLRLEHPDAWADTGPDVGLAHACAVHHDEHDTADGTGGQPGGPLPERTGAWVQSLHGEADHGPYDDEVAASDAMDALGLTDDAYKIVVY